MLQLSTKAITDGSLCRQPHIARRVRTIKIQSATFFPLLQPADRESSKLSAFLKALVRSRPAPPTATVFQLANQVITQATQAEALSLSSLEGFSYLPPEYFDLAAKAWTAPTDRLHTLEFRGSFIEFATLLRHVATPQKLQCLKLQVTSSQSYPPSYVQNATSACFDFVQQVSATLTELSIDVEPTGGLGIAERQDLLSRIFQSLHNPRLRSFKCNASETIVELELCLTSLLELIGRASPDLRELDVPGLGASEMPDCHFCKLESLTLTNLRTPFHTSPTSTDVLEAAEAYMTRCSCLTSLIFHGNTLSFPQLEGFLQTPPLYEPFQSLHRLQIKVKSLNPQLLAMLAETLTSLRYLTIHHHGLVPDASLEGLVGGWATPQFTTVRPKLATVWSYTN